MTAGSAVARPADVWTALRRRLDETEAATGADTDIWERLEGLADPGEFRPKLAADIEIRHFQLRWGNDYTMIANPRDLIHYKLDPDQARVVRLMDGTRTLREIVVSELEGTGDLEISGIADLVQSLHVGNFFEQRYFDVAGPLERALRPESRARTRFREFSRSLSLETTRAHRPVRWLFDHGLKAFFHRWVQIPAGLVSVVGLVAFVVLARSHRHALTGHSLALGFLILLALNYFLIVVHETAHALVLVRNGRRVRAAGIGIYFGALSFFVDSSDGLMMERRQRIAQAFAGPYAETIVAGAAAIVAWAFPGAAIAGILYRFCVLNYVYIFLNLIPLLELDGYWILSDLIDVPELRPMSLAFLRHDLWHKIRTGARWTRQEVGLAVYGILGVAFTVVALGFSFFVWREIFGGLVTRLWHGGAAGRFVLVALAVVVASPLLRGAMEFAALAWRRLRGVVREVAFRVERGWRVEAAELIDALPLFDDVPVDALNELAGRVRLRSVGRGESVVRQGDRADAFFVVRRGTFEVVERHPDTGQERQLRVLGRGEGFGELGLAEGAPRTASVRALEEAEVFQIDKGTFDRLLADMVHVPAFAPGVQRIAELRSLQCFAHLEPDEVGELMRSGRWTNHRPGETIITQGEPGDAFYAVAAGQLEVIRDGVTIRTLGAGASFGEIALLHDVPRTATVRAITPARTFRLDRDAFNRLLRGSFSRGTLDPTMAPGRTWQH